MKRKYGKYLLLLAMILSICVMVCVACKDDEEFSYDYSEESNFFYEESSLSVSFNLSDLLNSYLESYEPNSQESESSIFSEESSVVSNESSLGSSVESSDLSSSESKDSSIEDEDTSSESNSEESDFDSSIEEESTSSSSVSSIESNEDSYSSSSIEIEENSSSSSIESVEEDSSSIEEDPSSEDSDSSSVEEDSSSAENDSSSEESNSSSGPTCGDDEHEEGDFVVGHVFMTYTELPTCLKSGYKREFCTGCDLEVFYEEYEALGHKEVTIPGFPSTCCTYGATESSYCERCKIELTSSQELPFIDHSYEWGSCKWCDLAMLKFEMVKKDFQEPYAVCLGPYTDATMHHPDARRVVIPAEVEIRDKQGFGTMYPVKEIAELAFALHYEIYSVEIGENIEKIGIYAFERCYNLKEVYDKSKTQVTKGGAEKNGHLSDYVKEEDFHYEDYDSKVSFSESGCIIYTDEGKSVLIGCRNTHEEVIIPEGVTEIGPYAFASASRVWKITVAASVTYMERYAFCYICPYHRILDKTECTCREPLMSITFKNPNNWYTTPYQLQDYVPVETDLSVDENAFYELMGKRDHYWKREENL